MLVDVLYFRILLSYYNTRINSALCQKQQTEKHLGLNWY